MEYRRTTPAVPKGAPTNPSAPPPKTATSSGKWRSPFKVMGETSQGEATSQEPSGNSSETVKLYDPYDPESSESEPEMGRGREGASRQPRYDSDLRRGPPEHFSTDIDHRDNRHWEPCYSQPGQMGIGRYDLSPDGHRHEQRSLSPGCTRPEQQPYSPDLRAHEPLGGDAVERPLDQRAYSPGRLGLGPSMMGTSAPFPAAAYGGNWTNGEERLAGCAPNTEMTTAVRLSPPRFQLDHQLQTRHTRTGMEKEVGGSRSPVKEMEKSPFDCELCEVEFGKPRDLEDHLESRIHWDTLEHIQQQNSYDDLVIAFLQEVMVFKVRQCGPTVAESAIEALCEEEHMTKMEMFHCAACNVYVSTSTAAVTDHLSSQAHHHIKRLFGLRHKQACLRKAESMMKRLKAEFEQYCEGGNPFE